MSATELVRWTTRSVLLLLALLTFADLLRERDRKRFDIHLVFAALAGTILIGIAQRWSATTAGWPTRAAWGLLVAEPYLLVRIIGHFRPVRAVLRGTALAALLASYAILALTPLPPPLWAIGFGVVSFVLVEGFAAFSLADAARSTRGPTRWRLALAASGTSFLLAAIGLAGVLAFWRPAAAAAAPIAPVLMLGVALSYYVAFAPPRWLHRGWQFTHLQRFLNAAAGRSGADRAATMLELLGPTALEAVGGITAAVALREPDQDRLVFRPSSRHALSGVLSAEDGALARAWRDGKPAYTESMSGLGAEEGRLAASLGARALYALPIATPERIHGLLLVFNQHGPLFPADDLALLALFADQTAVAVEEAEVLEQRQGLLARIQDSEQRYRLLFANSPQPTWVFDAETLAFLAVNEAAVRHYGYAVDEFLGMTIRDVSFSEDVAALIERLRSPGRAGAGQASRHRKRDGTLIDVEVHSDRLTLAGRAVGLVIVNDVTERRRAEQEIRKLSSDLARRAEELTATNHELEAFSYSVSHDLRAPLRQVDGFSRILLDGYGERLDAEAQRYLQRIRSGATQMGQLIDDLLNLSRVTRKEIQMRTTDLRALAEAIVAELKAEAGDRNVEWRVGALPYVECDAALMKQVLVNLLQNALKFTRPRSPAIIELGELRRDHDRVVFVRDNGVGFDMKYHEKLFGVFQRLHGQEEFEGTGVGLATVQRIVHRHGGRIWSESELGRGATFFFTCRVSEEATHVAAE